MIAPWIFVGLCFGLVLFQIALTLGAPWGHLTQGGFSPGRLPPHKRGLAAASALLLLAMAGIVTAYVTGHMTARWPLWPVLVITVLTTIANFATPSRAERRLGGPVSLMMLAALLWTMTRT